MSRIRNTLRFQSPEERVLNALLLVVVVALVSIGVMKLRDGGADAATEVRGVQIERTLPATGGHRARAAATTTTTAPGATTTTVAPDVLWRYAQAVLDLQRATGVTTTSTTRAPAPSGNPGIVPPPPSTVAPVVSTTTRPRPTTTTTRPRPTTTTTTTTTTTPTPPLT